MNQIASYQSSGRESHCRVLSSFLFGDNRLQCATHPPQRFCSSCPIYRCPSFVKHLKEFFPRRLTLSFAFAVGRGACWYSAHSQTGVSEKMSCTQGSLWSLHQTYRSERWRRLRSLVFWYDHLCRSLHCTQGFVPNQINASEKMLSMLLKRVASFFLPRMLLMRVGLTRLGDWWSIWRKLIL